MVVYLMRYLLSIIQLTLNIYSMSNYLTQKRKNKTPIILYILLSPFIVLYLNSYNTIIVNLISSLLMTTLLSFVVYKEKWKLIALVGFATYAFNMFCELVILYVATMALNVDPQKMLELSSTELVYSLLAMLLFFVISWIIRNFVKHKSLAGKPLSIIPSFRYILLPFSLILVGFFVLYCTYVYTEDLLSRLGLVIFITLIIVDAVLLFGSEREGEKYRLITELDAMHMQNDLTEEAIRLQERYLDDIRGRAHDFKKQVLNIEALINSAHTSVDTGTLNYIGEVLSELEEVEASAFPAITNNALRVIIVQTAESCKHEKISFRVSISYSDFSFITHKDICAIFVNALENSIRACRILPLDTKKNAFIELSIKCPNQLVQIHIVNPKSTEIVDKQGVILTTKDEEKWHGYGIRNIERTVKSYDGIVLKDYSEDLFNLYITIPVPDSNQ